MISTRVILPWPDRLLHPNARVDRRWLTNNRQTARMQGWQAAQDVGLVLHAKPMIQVIKICPPNNLNRDDDGVIGAMKSYRDGIFKACGVDDKRIRMTFNFFGRNVEGGAVYVWFIYLSPGWLEELSELLKQEDPAI